MRSHQLQLECDFAEAAEELYTYLAERRGPDTVVRQLIADLLNRVLDECAPGGEQ